MKMLRVGPGHAAEGIGRVEGLEDPTVAVGRGDHAGLQLEELRGKVPQLAPDGHPFPVDAEPLARDRRHARGHTLLQLGQQHL